MNDRERIHAIVDVAARLADAASPLGVEARASIAREGALSGPMADWAVRAVCSRYTPAQVARCAEERPFAGRDVALVLAASVPTAPLRAIALPVLRGARRLTVRPSRAQPAFATLVVGALAEAGVPVAVSAAEAPEAFVSRALAQGADVFIAYGGDETLRSIRGRLPAHLHFEGHGHGFGVVLVSREASDEPASVDSVARDIAYYDQNGCLSPQAVFVEGADAGVFARRLAESLAALEATLPRGPLEALAGARVNQWQGAVAAVAAGFWRGPTFSVAELASARFVGGPGARNVAVSPAPTPAAVVDVLAPHAAHLTCVGFAGERSRWALPLGAAPRQVAAGTMQDPSLDGPEDPRPPLR